MTICYLALGSNLNTPERQLRKAHKHVKSLPKTTLLDTSPLYFNKAEGRRAQPPFCNSVIKISTTLPPRQLLKHCQSIEKKHKRVRKIRWGARTLDVDILKYGHLKMESNELTIPHPRMHERDFVMIPLSLLHSN